MSKELGDFIDKCKSRLDQQWMEVATQSEQGEPEGPLGTGHHLIPLIQACLTSTSKTYHYVLPTQLLAKAVDPDLDAHCLQAGYNVPGAFDARTVAHKIIVPFDQANHRVLGGSPEPYVNNPLRVPAVTAEYRSQQKAKADWDKLVAVLDTVENAKTQAFVNQVLSQVLFEIYKLLADVEVTYPTPNRVSLDRTHQLIRDYVAVASGGDRMEAVCAALFRTIGDRFGLFDTVKREKVNVADASSGMLADIECWVNDKITLLVEVKDRVLTLIQLDTKLDLARSRHIAEILFVAQSGTDSEETEDIDDRIASEFISGQNVYVSDFFEFSLGILVLLGEAGRVEFLNKVEQELDRACSAIAHRKAWAGLLKQS